MTVPCSYCGTPITGRKSRFTHTRGKNRYCSKECTASGLRMSANERLKKPAVTLLGAHYIKEYGGKRCAVCGFDRFVEFAHIIARKDGGTIDPVNIIPLCPNHHRLFDRNLLNEGESEIIKPRIEKANQSPNSRFKVVPIEELPCPTYLSQ